MTNELALLIGALTTTLPTGVGVYYLARYNMWEGFVFGVSYTLVGMIVITPLVNRAR